MFNNCSMDGDQGNLRQQSPRSERAVQPTSGPVVNYTQKRADSVKEHVGKAKPKQKPDKAKKKAELHLRLFEYTPAQGFLPSAPPPFPPHGAPSLAHCASLFAALAPKKGNLFPLNNGWPELGGRIDEFRGLLGK